MRSELSIFSAPADRAKPAIENVNDLRTAMRIPVYEGFRSCADTVGYIRNCFTHWATIVPQLGSFFQDNLESEINSLHMASKVVQRRPFRKPPQFLQALFDKGLDRDQLLRITAGNTLMLLIEGWIFASNLGEESIRTLSVGDFSFEVPGFIAEGVTIGDAAPRVCVSVDKIPFIAASKRGEEFARFTAENLPLLNRVPPRQSVTAFFFLDNQDENMGTFDSYGKYVCIGTVSESNPYVFLRDKVTSLILSIHEIRHAKQFSAKNRLPRLFMELDADFDALQAFRKLGKHCWERVGNPFSYEAYYADWAVKTLEYEYNTRVKKILDANAEQVLFADHNTVFSEEQNNRVLLASDDSN